MIMVNFSRSLDLCRVSDTWQESYLANASRWVDSQGTAAMRAQRDAGKDQTLPGKGWDVVRCETAVFLLRCIKAYIMMRILWCRNSN